MIQPQLQLVDDVCCHLILALLGIVDSALCRDDGYLVVVAAEGGSGDAGGVEDDEVGVLLSELLLGVLLLVVCLQGKGHDMLPFRFHPAQSGSDVLCRNEVDVQSVAFPFYLFVGYMTRKFKND